MPDLTPDKRVFKVVRKFTDKSGKTWNVGDQYTTTNVTAEEIDVHIQNGDIQQEQPSAA